MMSEQAKALRARYQYIVNLDVLQYDPKIHESLYIEKISVVVWKATPLSLKVDYLRNEIKRKTVDTNASTQGKTVFTSYQEQSIEEAKAAIA